MTHTNKDDRAMNMLEQMALAELAQDENVVTNVQAKTVKDTAEQVELDEKLFNIGEVK